MPKQSARLVLVNDVNFMLYTPFLPEAAAGTLEPRHVVTPLRDILDRTYLRLGAITGHDPGARTVELRTHDGEIEQLRYDQLLLSLGSVSRVLPVPGPRRARDRLQEPRRRDLAAQPRDRDARGSQRDRGPDPPRRAPHLRLRRRRLRRARGARRAPGLCRRRDGELPARSPARDALDPGRGRRPRAARDRPRARRLRPARAARPRHRHPARDDAGGGDGDSAPISTGETLPTRTCVWTAGVAPQPSLRKLSVPLDERGRVPVDAHLRVEGMDAVWAIGDCAAAPDPRGGPCPPTAQHAVRQGPVAARNIAAALGVGTPSRFNYKGKASFVNLGRYKAVGRLGSRTFRGFPAWWMARTYHLSQIPGAPARRARSSTGPRACRSAATSPRSAQSATRVRVREEAYERGGSHGVP